jgi:hypothetical protein
MTGQRKAQRCIDILKTQKNRAQRNGLVTFLTSLVRIDPHTHSGALAYADEPAVQVSHSIADATAPKVLALQRSTSCSIPTWLAENRIRAYQ